MGRGISYIRRLHIKGNELTEIIVTYVFSEQHVADCLDDLPVVNSYDPYSTVVDFDHTKNFAFA